MAGGRCATGAYYAGQGALLEIDLTDEAPVDTYLWVPGLPSDRSGTPAPHPASYSVDTAAPAPQPVGIADLAGAPGEAAKSDLGEPKTRRWNLPRHREWTRSILAWLIVGSVPGVVAAAWIAFLLQLSTPDNIRDISSYTLAAVTGLGGAVMGFYFGERSRTK